VPPEVLGQLVEVRRAVDATEFTVRWAGNVVVTHQLSAEPGNEIVWDPAHRAATGRIALNGRQRTDGRYLHLVAPAGIGIEQLRLVGGDFDVDTTRSRRPLRHQR
jgi:hypothetical protein